MTSSTAAHGWSSYPTAARTAAWIICPGCWTRSTSTIRRRGSGLLDVFSVHFYPQGGEFGSDVGRRDRRRCGTAPRAQLWDPNYTSESWIKDQVQLIPRLKGWVNTYYPGTKIGLTEYNWGAEGDINGATAQADLLGIFGREGLDLATRWTTPDTDHAHLQGDEDVPQLRRAEVRLWRRQRFRRRAEP